MFQNYVLKSSELVEAVLRGCKELGFVPDEVADAALKNIDSVSFEQVANGGLLGIDSELAVDAPKAARSNGAEPKARPAAAPAQAASEDGPPAEKVKAALGASMDRPPRLSTVRSWTATQRRKALKWARHPEGERPDFIQEPAARGSRTAATATAENGASKPEEPAPAGNKSESASRRAAAAQKPTNNEVDDDDDDDDDEDDDNGSQFFADETPEGPDAPDPPGN